MKAKMSRKELIIRTVLFVICIILIAVMVIKNISAYKRRLSGVLDEEYIKNEIVINNFYTEEVLLIEQVDDTENYLCLCRDGGVLAYLRLVRTKTEYVLSETNKFYLSDLNDDYTSRIGFPKPSPFVAPDKYYITSGVFLNPQTDTIKVNGSPTQVHKVTFTYEDKEYNLGVWAKAYLQIPETFDYN